MKKTLGKILLLLVLLVPFVVKADSTDDKKVKVYIFEAGGCPYCEKEVEYLESLDSYNKKFTIERKELYIDHINWEKGKDYNLGVKVANAFLAAGFEDASYSGTPFVVISDLYAAAAYSASLETVINQAYETGDKDVVGCYADGRTDCLEGVTVPASSAEKSNTAAIVIISILVIGCAGVAIYLISKSED